MNQSRGSRFDTSGTVSDAVLKQQKGKYERQERESKHQSSVPKNHHQTRTQKRVNPQWRIVFIRLQGERIEHSTNKGRTKNIQSLDYKCTTTPKKEQKKTTTKMQPSKMKHNHHDSRQESKQKRGADHKQYQGKERKKNNTNEFLRHGRTAPEAPDLSSARRFCSVSRS